MRCLDCGLEGDRRVLRLDCHQKKTRAHRTEKVQSEHPGELVRKHPMRLKEEHPGRFEMTNKTTTEDPDEGDSALGKSGKAMMAVRAERLGLIWYRLISNQSLITIIIIQSPLQSCKASLSFRHFNERLNVKRLKSVK